MTHLPVELLVLFTTILGLLIGSFLNVVIYRVPAGKSVVHPGSACPSCEAPIAWFDNIPVLSWVFLRGRCRNCGTAISPRYALIETLTGALFAAAAVHFGWDSLLIPILYVLATGVALAFIDLDTMRLPDKIVLPTYLVLPILLVIASQIGAWPHSTSAWGGPLLWAAVFAIPWFVTAGRGIGLGDVKLAPLLGLTLGWLGWGPAVVGLMASFLLGTVYGLAAIAVRTASRKTKTPFGPFMILGTLVGIFAGQPIWDAYLKVTGIN